VSILIVVITQRASVRVNLTDVLKLSEIDKVDCVGEWSGKMKLHAKVALFHKLKMISRAVVWGQVKTES